MRASPCACVAQVQSWTPQLVLTPLKQMPANKHVQARARCAAPSLLTRLLRGSAC